MAQRKTRKLRPRVRTQKLEADFRRALRQAKAAGSRYMTRRGVFAATGVFAIEFSELFEAAQRIGSTFSAVMPSMIVRPAGRAMSDMKCGCGEPMTGVRCGCVPGGPPSNPFEKLDSSNCPTHGATEKVGS